MARLPIANLLARKLRTVISMLAVGVGVALFLLLVGLTGMLGEIAERTTNVDAHMMVWPKSDQVFISGGLPAVAAERKLEAIDGVDRAIPVLRRRLKMAGKAQNVYGIRPEDWPYFGPGGSGMVDGRPLAGGDEMVIDTRLARAGPYALGQEIEAWDRTFTIVGIAPEGVAGRVFMPIETIGHALDRETDVLRASFFYVRVAAPSHLTDVRTAVEGLGLRAVDFEEFYDHLSASFADMDLVVGAVIFVAGFVCFLVILLNVYTMVLERTRELGILKGIGASRAQIFGLVMAEAILICVGGIGMGFVLTVGGKALIVALQPLWTIEIPPIRYAVAAALAGGGTVLGAIVPAMRAARQDPVKSLRYE